jgi:uncharacterized protein YukE
MSAKAITNATSIIPKYASQVKDSIQGWRGDTIDSFKQNYVNQFDYIIGIQANLGKILRNAAKAECDAYDHAQKNLLDLMDDFTDGVNNLGSFGGDDKDILIDAAFAVASTIGMLAPPVGAVLAVAGNTGATGLVKRFATQHQDKPKAVLEGSSLPTLWGNLKHHLHTIRTELQDVEKTLHDALSDVQGALGGQVRIGHDHKVAAMDLLMPPEPGFVKQVEAAATGDHPKKDVAALKAEVEKEVRGEYGGSTSGDNDQIEAPNDSYSPEPYDT